MGFDKVVDSSKLDGAMAATAEVIRWKTNSTDKVVWDEETGFREAVRAISGVGLQEKTVAPKHSEQVIVPDEQYDGLSSVKVLAVPKVKAMESVAKHDINNVLEKDYPFQMSIDATAGDYVQTHALYGGVRLPVIPDDILAQCPYLFIYKNREESFYRLMLSNGIWWCNNSGNDYLYPVVTESRPVYKAALDDEEWEFLENHSASSIHLKYYYSSYYNDFYWSNFNVPSGSATSTSYYKQASEPGLTV